MSADQFIAFLKKIEDRVKAMDATMRESPGAAAVAYSIGVFLSELKNDIQKARAT